MGTKGFLTGFFPSSWKSSMWSGGGGALPPLPFSIRVAGVEEKQEKKKRGAFCNSGGAAFRVCSRSLAAAALQLVRRGRALRWIEIGGRRDVGVSGVSQWSACGVELANRASAKLLSPPSIVTLSRTFWNACILVISI